MRVKFTAIHKNMPDINIGNHWSRKETYQAIERFIEFENCTGIEIQSSSFKIIEIKQEKVK